MKKLFILFLLLFPSSALASTWGDVLAAWAAAPFNSNCVQYVEKYGSSGYRIWERCGASGVTSYTKRFWSGTGTTTVGFQVNYCDGTNGSSYQPSPVLKYVPQTERTDTTYCNGLRVPGTPASRSFPHDLSQPDCWIDGWDNTTACASYDTLIADFPDVQTDCTYDAVTVTGSTGFNETFYSSTVQGGFENSCNQCIPAGMLPDDSNPAHNTVNSVDSTLVNCRWVDITGDPAKYSDDFVPPATGGGYAGNTGAAVTNQTSTSTTTTADGETYTTTTTTQVKVDGTTETTTTETLTTCIDANFDGLSDISGRACGSSSTTTTTEDTGVSVPPVDSGLYDTTVELPVEQDWVGLVSGYMTNNPMITTIQGTGFELTDAQCSFPVQIYGKTASLDFCALSSWLDVFGFLFVGLCALRSVFMAMGVD